VLFSKAKGDVIKKKREGKEKEEHLLLYPALPQILGFPKTINKNE